MWIIVCIALSLGILGAYIFGISIGRWKEQKWQHKPPEIVLLRIFGRITIENHLKKQDFHR